ncbi:MAG: DUF2851 family protein [Rikenellaceae bacterium]
MTIDQLKAEAKHSRCGERLARCNELNRQEIFCALEHERLMRKYHDIEKIYTSQTSSSWSEVFYIMFMRTLGDEANRDTFMEVARRVKLSYIQRERSNPQRVEAMLMGASGLLECYPNGDYVEALRKDADYLLSKYNITPILPLNWNLARVHPINHPAIKLSQAAMLMCKSDLIFNDLLLCRNLNDVDSLFKVTTSQLFMDTHPHLVRDGRESISIGASKRALLGINLVVPILYAYGYYLHDDDLCSQAEELNESLPAEMNRFIKYWRSQGLYPTSAYESQALIQLSTIYCRTTRCEECPVGRHIVAGVI